MPRTAAAFLVGSAAIVGLPPLNGFVSEWVLVQGLLHAGQSADLLRFASLGIAGIALVGALALACFARLGGIVFLGHARDRTVGLAHDVGAGEGLPMLALAAVCVAIGALPASALESATRVAGALAGPRELPAANPLPGGAPAMLGVLAGSILAITLLTWAGRALVRRPATRVGAATWGCGYATATPRMQYSAASFGSPILRAFLGNAGARATPAALRAAPYDRFLRNVAYPAWRGIRTLAESVRPLQQGRVTAYLQNMMWTVLLLLGFMLFASTGGRP